VRIALEDHSLELRGRSVLVDGVEVPGISQREHGVLRALVDRRGAVVSKSSLLADVWGEGDDEHVVEVTVARLRGRLGDAGSHIETVVRRGYRLAVANESNGSAPAGSTMRRSSDRVGLLSGGT
jgi:uroporphyrinogen-III synthase